MSRQGRTNITQDERHFSRALDARPQTVEERAWDARIEDLEQKGYLSAT